MAPVRRSTRSTRDDSLPSKSAAPPSKRAVPPRSTRAGPLKAQNSLPVVPEAIPSNSKPKSNAKPKSRRQTARAPKQLPPFVVALPQAPAEHARPAPQLFGWGNADDGVLADGIQRYDFVYKPARSKWVEERMGSGEFGAQDAGLEAVAAGGFHTLFVDEAGTVWSCGVDDNASLGRDTKLGQDADIPHPITSLKDEGFRAVQIVAGSTFSAALSDKGDLRAWGTFRSSDGRPAFSPAVSKQHTPVAIEGFSEPVAQIAAGSEQLFVLTAHGDVYTLGFGADGQLGRRVPERHQLSGTRPAKITRARRAVALGAGANHAFAVDAAGAVWGWGINASGQTGSGVAHREADAVVPTPRPVACDFGGERVAAVTGGQHHTLFLTSEGRVFACGATGEGRLGLAPGHPTLADEFRDFLDTPAQVAFPYDARIKRIACGSNCSFAIDEEGAMYCWGRQVTAELGLGKELADATSDRDVLTPRELVRRAGSWTAVDIACGGQHVVALLKKKA